MSDQPPTQQGTAEEWRPPADASEVFLYFYERAKETVRQQKLKEANLVGAAEPTDQD